MKNYSIFLVNGGYRVIRVEISDDCGKTWSRWSEFEDAKRDLLESLEKNGDACACETAGGWQCYELSQRAFDGLATCARELAKSLSWAHEGTGSAKRWRARIA